MIQIKSLEEEIVFVVMLVLPVKLSNKHNAYY